MHKTHKFFNIKTLIIFVAIFFSSLTSTTFVNGQENTGTTKTKENLNIRVGIYNNPPKTFIDEQGDPTGIWVDIMDYIGEQEGWEIKYISGVWSDNLARLESNEIDILGDIAFSQERNLIYDYNKEAVLTNWATLYTKLDSNIESIIDLNGKKVAVLENDIHYIGQEGIKNVAQQFGVTPEYIEVSTYEEVFFMLDKKEADAGIVNWMFGDASRGKYNVRKTSQNINPIELKFALTKDNEINQKVIKRIDFWINKMKENAQSIYFESINKHILNIKKTPSIILEFTPQEQAWLREHPNIKIGVDPSFAPYEFIDKDGEYRGIAADHLKLINERLGISNWQSSCIYS